VNHLIQPVRGERGIALVMALLVMLVIGILSATLMMSLTSESRLASYSQREAEALNVAEAGIAEACARIRNQDMLYSTANPREVAVIFNAISGNVPVLGADSLGFATGQPAGQWLPYSTAARSSEALTVEFKTNAARTLIYRYDPTLTPPINTVSGYPIYKITATGTAPGGVKRRVVTEVIQKPYNINVKGALTADLDIDFMGNGVVCGYDHRADTPEPTGESGRLNNPSCVPFEQLLGHKPGAWTTGQFKNTGAAYQTGSPMALDNDPANAGNFYTGPWECLGLQQAEFWPWIGARLADEPATPEGVFHFDNDNVKQNGTGSFAYHGTSGEGMLYVDGDLDVNSSFIYRGIVYVEGDFRINGQVWVLGAVVVKGKSEVKQNGGATILYSSEAIQQALARYGGQFVNLAWIESAN
jgi:Tfp pilus assembly protein PilX